jgi:hypothetical protein
MVWLLRPVLPLVQLQQVHHLLLQALPLRLVPVMVKLRVLSLPVQVISTRRATSRVATPPETSAPFSVNAPAVGV